MNETSVKIMSDGLKIHPTDTLKYVVTATPRSATAYMNVLFGSAGIRSGKEKIFGFCNRIPERLTVDCSWMSAPYLKNLKDIKIIHIVRDPIKVVSSIKKRGGLHKSGSKHAAYMWKHVPLSHPNAGLDVIDRYLHFWIEWNKMIEPYADFRFRIEDINKDRHGFFKEIGIDVPTNKKLFDNELYSSHNIASPNRVILTPEDIKGAKYEKEFISLANKYGYDIRKEK